MLTESIVDWVSIILNKYLDFFFVALWDYAIGERITCFLGVLKSTSYNIFLPSSAMWSFCLRRGDDDDPEAMVADRAKSETMNDTQNTTIATKFKYFCSTLLLIFSVVLVVSLIFTEQTQLSQASHPAFAFVLIWFGFCVNMKRGKPRQ